jgi:hypothetical protein
MPDAGCRMGACLLGLLLLVGTVVAQETVPAGGPPLPPAPKSPVEFFRQLLAMTPEARAQALTNRSDASRRIIAERLREYTGLSEEERELRLKAMHLRWLLLPLMKAGTADRATLLAGLSPEDRAWVEPRVRRWEAIPPELQAQFLEHESAIDFFVRIPAQTLPPMPPGLSPTLDAQSRRLDSRLGVWNALPSEDRDRMLGQFREFFELGPEAQSKTLARLGENERRLVDSARKRFADLPPAQRRGHVNAFGRLANMSPEQRTQFFRNVERWQAMRPEEKSVWRDLTRRVPDLPPLPPGMFPPLPSGSTAAAGQAPGNR